ncbi:MAG: SDR family NAD(P)-dependent oxidoreductase [Myxococcota bacterium]
MTGANRGMGQCVARKLAESGLATVWLGRDLEALQEASQGVPRASLLEADLSEPAQVERALRALLEGGGIDILVNNAAVYPAEDLLKMDESTWQRAVQINLLAPVRLTRGLVPGMVERRWGRVVQVSSGYGAISEGLPGPGVYAYTKAALNAFTLKLAQSLPSAVKANAVCPGWVRTRMGGSNASRSVEEGAAGILWAAELPDDGPSGGFFRDGLSVPW